MHSESTRWRHLASAAVLILLLGLVPTGCDLEEDTAPRPFGPGNGTAVIGNTPVNLLDAGGSPLGAFDYDNTNFGTVPGADFLSAADPEMGILVGADTATLQMVLIAGRPDTPCRFAAALDARDNGFTILGDGEDRINDQGVIFHEVWLQKGGETRRFACATLKRNLGVAVFAVAPTAAVSLRSPQVHSVLNSIRP